MKPKPSFIFLISFTFFSCQQDKELKNFPLLDTTAKIAIVGEISNRNQVRVRASKSIPSLGDAYADSLILENAILSLYKNNEFEQFLEEEEEGLFMAEVNVEESNTYKIRASANGLQEVNSKGISIPNFPIIHAINFEKTGELTINEQAIWKLDLNIRHQESIGYYRVHISVENYPNYSFETWFFDENSELCHFKSTRNNNIFFDASCILTDNFSVELFAQIPPFFSTINDNIIPIENIVVNVTAIDEHYYKYLDSFVQPSGLENGFAEPKLTYSNIENGYGVFYGYHNVDTVFIVQ